MPEAQAATWRATVSAMPPKWFGREVLPLLAAYCRHTANAALVADQIGRFEGDWLRQGDGLDRFDALSKVLDREHRAMSSLATRLRMTPQSRIGPKAAGTAADKRRDGPAPWEP